MGVRGEEIREGPQQCRGGLESDFQVVGNLREPSDQVNPLVRKWT